MPAVENVPPRFQCRHIFIDGRRCGSPTLRDEPFCYYHHTARPPVRRPRPVDSSFDLPVPEDRSAIQAGIGEILRRLAANVLDTKRAGLMLYALQIASLNLPKTKPAVDPAKPVSPVEEITNHPELGTLAPPTLIEVPQQRENFADKLIREFAAYERDEDGCIIDPSFPLPPGTLRWAHPRDHEDEIAAVSREQHPGIAGPPTPRPPQYPDTATGDIIDNLSAQAERVMPEVPVSPVARSARHRSAPARIEPHPHKQKSPPRRVGLCLCRRSPNLPHTFACSTIGPTRLNFRVRDGNGWDPRGKLTGKLSNVLALAIVHN